MTDSTPCAPRSPAQLLTELVSAYRESFLLPDPGPLLLTLGVVAANKLPGKPVWLLLVGSPGSGKSTVLSCLSDVPGVRAVGDVTKAGLLSGSSMKDRHRNSMGGLLKEIGSDGILVWKDFGSICSMRADNRQSLMGALREVYDGTWNRDLGNDGGLPFSWRGKLGLLGGCTSQIDVEHALLAAMGERFTFYRMPLLSEEQAAHAVANAGRERGATHGLAEATKAFFAAIKSERPPMVATGAEAGWMLALAALAAAGRSVTLRDGRNREIEVVPEGEAPTRLAEVLTQLRSGLLRIGCSPDETWPLLRKVGLDSMPAIRVRALELLGAAGERCVRLAEVVAATRCSDSHVRRHLEDLEAFGVVTSDKTGDGYATDYRLSDWARVRLGIVGTPPSPEAGSSPENPPDPGARQGGAPENPPTPLSQGRKVNGGTGGIPGDPTGGYWC